MAVIPPTQIADSAHRAQQLRGVIALMPFALYTNTVYTALFKRVQKHLNNFKKPAPTHRAAVQISCEPAPKEIGSQLKASSSS